jgi:hypothetical protein
MISIYRLCIIFNKAERKIKHWGYSYDDADCGYVSKSKNKAKPNKKTANKLI